MPENALTGTMNRLLQLIARIAPGARTWRVWLHRLRGISIGENSWIGYDSVLETSKPHLISIGKNVVISMRVTMIAHFHEASEIHIEDDVFIGPGAIILPNVTIGKGAVVTAGSVVGISVPPRSMVQGNPGRVVATCNVPLGLNTSLSKFYGGLRRMRAEDSPLPTRAGQVCGPNLQRTSAGIAEAAIGKSERP